MRGPSTELLRNRVYEVLRAEIITGVYNGPERIQEAMLAAKFGVSKTPVREALARLVQEGLVEVWPRMGYTVRTHSYKEIEDLFDLRTVLESATAERAAELATPLEIDQLEQWVVIPVVPGERESYLAYLSANRQFHLLLARCSRNDYLYRAVETTLAEVTHVTHYRLDIGDPTERTAAEHRLVVDALRAHDAQAARQAMEETIQATKQEVLRALMAAPLTERI